MATGGLCSKMSVYRHLCVCVTKSYYCSMILWWEVLADNMQLSVVLCILLGILILKHSCTYRCLEGFLMILVIIYTFFFCFVLVLMVQNNNLSLITQVGFKSCVQDFRNSRIDGAALLNMTVSQLRAFPSLSDARNREYVLIGFPCY